MTDMNSPSNSQLRRRSFNPKQRAKSTSHLKNQNPQSETDYVKNNSQKSLSTPSKKNSEKCRTSRLYQVWILLMLGLIGLIINLFRLQVVQGKALQKIAQQQQTIQSNPFIPRRPIVDRNGNVLAIDKVAYTLYAHPKIFNRSKQEVA
ncbi:MAG: penicillin-binding protein 2, partial [Okeania sp. SIO2F4]|nr:penicillin-binding protein 2 [Okeania sp. SIO2F4]